MLAALLIAAQLGATVHAFEHDPGAPQSKPCSACVTATQLAAALVDAHTTAAVDSSCFPPTINLPARFDSTDVVVARQRGPPTPLQTF